MIEVRFSAATRADLHATMREYLGEPTVTGDRSVPSPAKVLTHAPEAPTPAPAVSAATPAIVGYAAIADLIPKLVSKHGKPKVVALLETFGVKNGKELKVDQYEAFLNKAAAELPLV